MQAQPMTFQEWPKDAIEASNESGQPRHHVTDGLFFLRHDDGSVTIAVTCDGQLPKYQEGPPDGDSGNVSWHQTLTADEWKSVIHSMPVEPIGAPTERREI